MRQVTPRGRDAIIRLEGLRREVYRDPAGLLTLGVGHLLSRSELTSGKLHLKEGAVSWDGGISEAQAHEMLRRDLAKAEHAVERYAPGLNDAQFDALCSWVFNVGVEAFEHSTLLAKIRAGQLDDVPQQMRRWTRAAGVILPGLIRRREQEAALWSR